MLLYGLPQISHELPIISVVGHFFTSVMYGPFEDVRKAAEQSMMLLVLASGAITKGVASPSGGWEQSFGNVDLMTTGGQPSIGRTACQRNTESNVFPGVLAIWSKHVREFRCSTSWTINTVPMSVHICKANNKTTTSST